MAKGQTIAMKCEACRREGTKLFLKGTRCESPKCAFHRRDFPPGQHPFRRGKISEYGVRLREKQRCKRTFGMREHPFRRLFALAERQTGNTGENLFRMGLARSRRHARQAIAHGLVFVNGHKLDRASYLVEINDTIKPRSKEKVLSLFKAIKESTKGRVVPSWLDVQPEPLEGKVIALPKADELAEGFEPQLIVEICAR
jgi:small subunit ribosomal protein S4